MPIYQYHCAACERRVELFFRSAKSAVRPACPECGSKQLRRVISRVARVRSAGDRVGSIDLDRELGRLEGSGEAEFARWARQLGDRYDDELGSDFRDLAERADAGADPVERADPVHTLRHRVEQRREELAGGGEEA
jgi:putative FmdB family regulatory protein